MLRPLLPPHSRRCAGWLLVGTVACAEPSDVDATVETATGPEALPASATGQASPEDPQWASLATRPCPEDSYLDTENFGRPFMLSWCTGCHSADMPAGMRQGAPPDVNFDTSTEVRDWADRIWARSGDHNGSMPPVAPAPLELRRQLGEWLACGAP
ncbi:MAG: hypothetical protein B7733_14150 [Myxococcales bacterium FL481]|nr:MAG: hypothetical protein B7733_14150 [Myxococcales bacterium FL481]